MLNHPVFLEERRLAAAGGALWKDAGPCSSWYLRSEAAADQSSTGIVMGSPAP